MFALVQWKEAVINPEINFRFLTESPDLESREPLRLAINVHFQSPLGECLNDDRKLLC